MSENISDREIYFVTAGGSGYQVHAEYGGMTGDTELGVILNDLASRLRTLEASNTGLVDAMTEAAGTMARQEREITALHEIIDIQGMINSVVEGQLIDIKASVGALTPTPLGGVPKGWPGR